MQQTNGTKNEKSRGAVKKAEKALEEGFAEVKTPSQAAEVLDKIEHVAGDMEEQDLAPGIGSADPVEQAKAVNDAAVAAAPNERPAVVLTEAAAQIAAAPVESRESLDEAVAEASGEPGCQPKQSRRRSSAVEPS